MIILDMSIFLNDIFGYFIRICIVQLDIQGDDNMEIKDFSQRLSQLRLNKDVSARDMSLSIGQSPSYINNIETGVSFPSMTAFFYICEYLGISPQEFFDIKSSNPVKEKELLEAAKGLSNEQLDHLIAIARGLNK